MARDSGSGGPGRRSYEAQEVLRLLGVKAHVLRYWEQSLPLIRPRRNESGHRVWSAAQVRMLLRIRHLVLRRGMSVAAAGNAILYEAEPGPADTKARLESLRAGLITLLLRSRAELARASYSPRDREPTVPDGTDSAVGAAHSGDAAIARAVPEASELPGAEHRPGQRVSRRLEGQPIILDRFVAPRRYPDQPGGSGRGGASSGGVGFGITAGPSSAMGASATGASPTGRSSTRRITLRHLERIPLGAASAIGSPEGRLPAIVPIAHLLGEHGDEASRVEVLARLLELHRDGIGDAPLVIPAPAGEVDRYESLLSALRGSGIADSFLLPVSPVSMGGSRWWSPRLALMIEIGSHQELGTWLAGHGGDTVYLWSPDDPALSPRPNPRWVGRARESRQGIAVAAVVRTSPGAVTAMRIPDGAVLFLDAFRSALTEILAVGRWTFVPGRDALPGPGTWRYDLRQRDLLRLDVPVLVSSGRWSPAPWRGDDWGREVDLLCSRIQPMGEA